MTNEQELLESLEEKTEDELLEILTHLKLNEDFPYFSEKILKVQTMKGKIIPFALNFPQNLLHDIIENYIRPKRLIRLVILKARRMGFSTYFSGRFYQRTSRVHNRYTAQITHEPEATDTLFKMVKRFYNFSPPEERPETLYNNTRLLEFNNKEGQGLNSAFRVCTAGKEDFGSGQTIHYAHLCMHPDVPVLVEHGREKRIADLQLGDVVLTHNGNKGRVSHITRTTPDMLPNGDEALSIQTWLGEPLIMTPQHKVYTNMGWVEAKDLESGWHFLSMPIRRITDQTKSLPVTGRKSKYGPAYKGPTEFPLNEETGFAIGYYLAEGCLARAVGGADTYHRVIFTLHQDEDAFAQRACAAIAPFCKSPAKAKCRVGTKTKTYSVDSGVLANFINENFGCVDEKHIPDWVFDCGEDFCRGIVAGYLAGDGSKGIGGRHQNYDSNAICASSIRESITYQLRDLVAALGYGWGGIRRRKGGVFYGRNCRAQWTVFFSGECGYKLRELVGIERKPISENSINGQRYRMDFQHNRVWLKIKKIEKTSHQEFYDIEVDHEDHSFRTPHFSVSNSEVSKWDQATIDSLLTSILQTVPDDPDTAVVFESTAKGIGGEYYDRFWDARYRIWIKKLDENGKPVIHEEVNTNAPEDNIYTSIFFPWFVFPDYRMPVPEGFTLTREEEETREKYGLDLEQMVWRRWVIANKTKSEDVFNQEYPACIVGSSRVGTEFGLIPIADLHHCEGTFLEHGTLSGWYPKGIKPVFKVSTSLGYEVVGTEDHKVAVDGGDFVEIKDLAGQVITLQPPKFATHYQNIELASLPCVTSTLLVDKDFGRFVGYFMGDGSFHDNTLSIVCTAEDKDVVADVVGLFRSFFGEPQVRVTGAKKGCVEVRISRASLHPLLLQLGMIRSNGGVRRVVHVPEFIFRSPASVVREFLRGLFEADGFAGKGHPRVSLFSRHMDFLRDVQMLLLGFGITCRRVSRPAKSGYGFDYTSNTLDLRLNESVRFGETVGFVSARKQARMSDSAREKKQKNRSNCFDLELKDRVLSIEAAGEEEVYDITVQGNPWFSANGILVHNCPEHAFLGSGRPVFDNLKLLTLKDTLPAPVARYECLISTYQWLAKDDGRLWVWEEPKSGGAYIISADVSEGLKEGDFSCADVIDHRTGLQVAQWHGKIDPDAFGLILIALGRRYNNAWIAPERNNHGLMVVTVLVNENYPRVYAEMVPEPPGKPRKRFGWLTSNATRPLIIDNLIKEVRENSHGIRCPKTIEEMMSFKIQDNGKMEADVNRNDDRVMSYAIGKHLRLVLPLPSAFVNQTRRRNSSASGTRGRPSPKGWT